MDFSTFITNGEPTALEILHPLTDLPIVDEAGNKATLLVVGKDSKKFKDLEERLQSKKLAVLNRGGKIKLTTESLEDEVLTKLCATVVEVKNISLDGAPVTASKKDLVNLFEKCPFVRKQLEAFIEEDSNFIKDSSANS